MKKAAAGRGNIPTTLGSSFRSHRSCWYLPLSVQLFPSATAGQHKTFPCRFLQRQPALSCESFLELGERFFFFFSCLEGHTAFSNTGESLADFETLINSFN